MYDDHILRGLLATEALIALLFAGQWVGAVWHERGWPARVILLGALGVLTYVLAGQAKAFNLDIPFDGFSYLGLAAYTVLLVGFAWHIARERRNRRGR